MSEPRTREIRTDYLARVEGEGALFVRVRGDQVEEVQFKIFERPRFFEALLRGRQFTEALDLNARHPRDLPVAYIDELVQRDRGSPRVVFSRAGTAAAPPRSTTASGSRATCSTSRLLHAPDFLGYEAPSIWRATGGELVGERAAS